MLKKFWKNCLAACKRSEETKYAGVLCYGINVNEAEEAIQQILDGKRCGSIYPAMGYRCAMNGETQPGQINIVTDWNGNPRLAIETLEVRKVQFGKLTDEDCAMEQKGTTLENWQEKRMPAIKTELEELGSSLDDDTMLIVESYCVLYVGDDGV